jgi:hypothetical protein
MTDLLLSNALPVVMMLLAFAAWWRAGNMKVSISFESKTSTPEPSKGQVMVLRDQLETKRHERDEARRIAEEMRGGVP